MCCFHTFVNEPTHAAVKAAPDAVVPDELISQIDNSLPRLYKTFMNDDADLVAYAVAKNAKKYSGHHSTGAELIRHCFLCQLVS